jgi:tRNA(fMet)-specific endonuclease VapC
MTQLSDMCIYLIKHQPPEVRERFAKCFVGDVIISAVTLAELEFGIACTSEAYSPFRAAYKERSRDALDNLIASHAIALGVTLVTNNEADFVNDAGLIVENWVNAH